MWGNGGEGGPGGPESARTLIERPMVFKTRVYLREGISWQRDLLIVRSVQLNFSQDGQLT